MAKKKPKSKMKVREYIEYADGHWDYADYSRNLFSTGILPKATKRFERLR